MRDRLKFTKGEIPEIKLKALFCALDADTSGYIESSEFQKWLDRRVHTSNEERQERTRLA